LLYTKKADEKEFTARFAVSFVLFKSFESKVILDSASLLVKDGPLPEKPKDIISFIEFETFGERETLIEAKVTDLNRNQSMKAYINVDRTSPNCRQNFTVSKEGEKYPLFAPFISASDRFTISHKDKKVKYLIVRYYNRNYPLAAPPFSVEEPKPLNYQADSIFMIDASKVQQFGAPGFYHIQVDTFDKKGLTLYRYADNFPKLTTPKQMLEPIRFITSKQEYTKMEEAPDLKKAVDDFWINTAGSESRAKALISKFYNRVQDANQFFSSYLEGWKTDRGLIYLIYGPPNILYKSSTSETWIYGEENNLLSLSFTFYKVANPFSDEDYSLSRSPIYKSSWYRAVDSWRSGRIFTDN